MDESDARRADAALQAYNWAKVAGSPERAWKEWEQARALSNSSPDELSEWQRWLLDHLDKNQRLGAEQPIALAEMWVRVAAVQPTAVPVPEEN
ncbi:hypothetical protein [Streptomyces caeruleatus]|uniref:Uncharacterized protein n=1 Tax=Streptomyces caeruleatus TaxID=661399 RepID=A0A101U5F5_9ACTN|nr:hypothetical protein [Streptomyces caeruleatus]KUO04573.1 hypothetical protein AQJ67_10175 [Streptomyces caeruleatus]